jgi:hypothetical protein
MSGVDCDGPPRSVSTFWLLTQADHMPIVGSMLIGVWPSVSCEPPKVTLHADQVLGPADGLLTTPTVTCFPAEPATARARSKPPVMERSQAMKGKVGDWYVLKGRTVEQSDRRGLITEVHGVDGAPPYVVRWLDTGHVATVIPGPDAIVVTATEQEAADQRARSRVASVQTEITHQHPSE